MNQNTREHTKLIVLKEFVFKLDECLTLKNVESKTTF